MSSIRPLITITILVVVGAYLYVKINEGPVRPVPGASDAWEQPPDGVPPLTAGGVAPATSANAAPPWPATETPAPTTPAAVGASSDVAASTTLAPTDASPTVAAETPPAVPPIPEMPELATTTQADPPTTPSVPLPTELPANIPQARYPDDPATNETGASVDAAASAPPANSVAPATALDVAASATTTQELPTTPEQVNAATAAASGLTSAPLAAQPNPLRQSPLPTADIDRYGSTSSTTNPASIGATSSPVEPTFAASWPTIQAALDRGELAQAHQLLSRWYDDPSLTPTDAERVESLLNQLAGTVVYSTEHQLAPAHVVKPGETLETIAKEYNVPWQLLAKINGIAAADQVRPGQELKVVRGPFSAVVDLGRNQLTLMVDGRYAGKFPVSIAPGTSVSNGQWIVDQKLPSTERVIVLRREGAPFDAATGSPSTLTIASGAPSVAANAESLQVSARDAEELSDILSIGSRVVTRR